MFTGRRFDYETGLYYYRARYYNPYIGRFLQTDPIGYGDGINWYAYCGNNPLNFYDPSGCISWSMEEIKEGDGAGIFIRFTVYHDDETVWKVRDVCDVAAGLLWLEGLDDIFTDEWLAGQIGWKLSGENELTFWYLQAINKLGGGFDYEKMETYGITINTRPKMSQVGLQYDCSKDQVRWSPNIIWYSPSGEQAPLHFTMRDFPIKALAHELQHAWNDIEGANPYIDSHDVWDQKDAIRTENIIGMALIGLAPRAYFIGDGHTPADYIRPGGFSIEEPRPKPPWGIAF